MYVASEAETDRSRGSQCRSGAHGSGLAAMELAGLETGDLGAITADLGRLDDGGAGPYGIYAGNPRVFGRHRGLEPGAPPVLSRSSRFCAP